MNNLLWCPQHVWKMHTPLDAHLHTEECNKIIQELQRCRDETGKLGQLFGACNDLYNQMRRCTKAERLARTKKHLETSKEKQLKYNETIKKNQEEGKSWRETMKERREKAEAELNK